MEKSGCCGRSRLLWWGRTEQLDYCWPCSLQNVMTVHTATFHGAAVALSSLLRRCAPRSGARTGAQVHAQATTGGLLPNATLETDLLLCYTRCSFLDDAWKVFDRMPHRNMHSWNIFFSCYVRHSFHATALSLFLPFLHSGLRPDHFTLPSLFKACAGAGYRTFGELLHGWAIMLGLDHLVIVWSSILDMYAKCGSLVSALYLFDTMPERDAVAWNSMISGFARAGYPVEALGLFRRSTMECPDMDLRAIPSVLGACGREGDLKKGREIHGKLIRGLVSDTDVAIGNSLIEMYAKCGSVEESCKVFARMGMRNLVTWSTLISCYGVHGRGEEALRLYKEMIAQGLKPNCVTFTSVLSSCSHSGLVDEGRSVFDSMSRVHRVEPGVEHYACMVDMLGRSGSIREALRLIGRMPVKPVSSVWGALLGACAAHKNVKVGEIAAHKLFELEGGNPSNYVALCGIYEAVGMWGKVRQIRVRMRELGIVKSPGCSWVAVDGKMHAFYQGDRVTHQLRSRIHEVLNGLGKAPTMASYPEIDLAEVL